MNLRVLGGDALLRLLASTWAVEREGEDILERARRASPRGNVIFAFWHSSLVMLGCTHRHRGIHVLVSQHRDGELIARILERLGYGLVRGSSRRGGVEALFRLATLIETGHDVGVTVDGPIGPRYRVHRGVVLLARRTGRPIVPVVPTYARGLRLPTWDELRLPLPGTRLRVRYLAPIEVPGSLPPCGIGAVESHLETVLRDRTREEEARLGRAVDFEDVQDWRPVWERASEADPPHRALRVASGAYAVGLGIERLVRPRPSGRGGRPWVVGVGNLEAGGTGKTPCVLALAGALAASGIPVAVLSRGHSGELGRRPERLGPENFSRASDETRLLARHLGPGVPIVVSRDKAAGLESIRRAGGADVVLVDDAFQTARLAVDRHLVLLDWTRPLGNGQLLPAGRLREPPTALRRAHALLFTRAGSSAPPAHPIWAQPTSRLFVAFERCAGLRTPAGAAVPGESLRGKGMALLSGLGRPGAFEELARREGARHGFQVRRAVRVGDHAPIEPALRKLVGRLEGLGCEHVLVTEKDLLRLPPASQWNEPLLVLEQRLEIPELPRLLECLVPCDYFRSAKLANETDSDVGT